MDLQEATTITYNIVTSAAVVTGGIWAYFKFVRGRTFANRGELSVSASIERSAGRLYLCVTVVLKNTGLSKLPLNDDMKVIRLFGMVGQMVSGAGEIEWERIATLPVLDQHEWLEAQEPVTDTVAYRLPADNDIRAAYQVEAIVGARPRPITRRRVKWHARSFAFLPPSDPGKPYGSRLSLVPPGKTV